MSYSDNTVDLSVLPIFDGFVGYACDVGANDGRCNSNTLMFEEAGWTVLCIEPNPLLEEKGRLARKLWRQVACGAEDEDEAEFYSIEGHDTFASASALRNKSLPEVTAWHKTFLVAVRTLDRLLEEAGFSRLDYLTVDVEGWEREVMKGFSVERWKPKVIVLEEWTDEAIAIPGYSIVQRKSYDNIYKRNEP